MYGVELLQQLRRGRGSAGRGGVQALAFRRLRIDSTPAACSGPMPPVELTALEFDLLLALACYRGLVLSREHAPTDQNTHSVISGCTTDYTSQVVMWYGNFIEMAEASESGC